jgi:hypothetical protein
MFLKICENNSLIKMKKMNALPPLIQREKIQRKKTFIPKG